MSTTPSQVGVVVIGRNEGARLVRCLNSVVGGGQLVVYVDSGSTDGSLDQARKLGVDVIELDLSTPFTAARARNAGFQRLLAADPEIEFVQFVDGDCEIVPGWIDAARSELIAKTQAAVVCGRVRERFPESSIYNALCDMEWNRPAGEVKACGGIAMMRTSILREVNGFDPALIAGEEPELCFRMRQSGWKILRIDQDMTIHEAAMTRFGQWWQRSLRAGHAVAQLCSMHREQSGRRLFVRQVRSNWFWGIGLPIVALALAWPTRGWSLLLLAGYVVLGLRIYLRAPQQEHRAAYALFTVIGKLPQALGQAKFHLARTRGRNSRLIEYKGPDRICA